ncbi:MAG: caspase family protein [Bacteroidetes bacterium]|nr:caspase family protein [Bacteroidota bacterium]
MNTLNMGFSNGYALLIGVGNYPNVSPLPTTANDAEALYKLLTNPARAGYPEEQVRLLTNAQATTKNILDGLDWLSAQVNNNPQATVIVYFSGHGGNYNTQYILQCFDFEWEEWDTTSIPKEDFSKKINAIKPNKFLILLDCCYAAGMATKSSLEHKFTPSNEELYQYLDKGKGKLVVASSRADQLSYIYPGSRYSAFTEAMIRALDGEYGNDNGYVTILRALADITRCLKNNTGGKQIPVFNAEDVEDFAICNINPELSIKLPFTKTIAYLAEDYLIHEASEEAVHDLSSFKKDLLQMLDKNGFAAVPAVLEMIGNSFLEYNKPAYANLRDDALESPSRNTYIVKLKVLIGSLTGE